VKITETIERECCQREDLKPYPGQPSSNQRYWGAQKYVFCKHCGRAHEAVSSTDAAGSRDWEYRPLRLPWEPSPEELARRIEHAITP
jgi:hypothetical protein